MSKQKLLPPREASISVHVLFLHLLKESRVLLIYFLIYGHKH